MVPEKRVWPGFCLSWKVPYLIKLQIHIIDLLVEARSLPPVRQWPPTAGSRHPVVRPSDSDGGLEASGLASFGTPQAAPWRPPRGPLAAPVWRVLGASLVWQFGWPLVLAPGRVHGHIGGRPPPEAPAPSRLSLGPVASRSQDAQIPPVFHLVAPLGPPFDFVILSCVGDFGSVRASGHKANMGLWMKG